MVKYLLMFFIAIAIIAATIFSMRFFGDRIKGEEKGGKKTDLLICISTFVLFFATVFLFSGFYGIVKILFFN